MSREESIDPIVKHPAAFGADTLAWAASLTRRGHDLPDALEVAAAADVGQTPNEVVHRENKLTLHRYDPPDGPTQAIPILVAYALINRPYILDLQPDRSVIRRLRDAGFVVYLIDWGEPSRLDRSLGLADYVTWYLDRCVNILRDEQDVPTVNLLGYCMGGTMSAMYAALFPEKVNALGLMAAGLAFDDTGGVLELWGNDEYFEPNAVVEQFGNVPGEFLDAGFAMMNPIDNVIAKYVTLADNIDDEDFVANFTRMEQWLRDGIDVSGRAFVEFVTWIYQENRLAEGTLELDGMTVDPEAIEMPVLQIIGEYDHLIPPESSTPFNEIVGSDDVTTNTFSTGHIGLSVSSRSHKTLWPEVCTWFAERSEPGAARLETIDGIGDAYAQRLAAAGITDVESLAAADVDELAASVAIPRQRLESFIADAADRME